MSRGKTRKVVRSNKGKSTAPVRAQGGSKPRSSKKRPAAAATTGSAADIETRISHVYDWILEGQPSHAIVQKVAELWGIQERMAREYISRATERLKAESQARASTTLEDHLNARWHCYRRAHESGDTKTAAMILKDIGRLQCLYASDRSLLARAGLDESLKEQLESADSAAADILRQAYQPGDSKDD